MPYKRPGAAPGRLALVQAFVNTRDIDLDTDELTSPAGVRDWLTQQGLGFVRAPVDGADLSAAVAVREALRELLVANGDERAPSGGALEVLNDAAARAQLTTVFSAGGGGRLRASEHRGTGIAEDWLRGDDREF